MFCICMCVLLRNISAVMQTTAMKQMRNIIYFILYLEYLMGAIWMKILQNELSM